MKKILITIQLLFIAVFSVAFIASFFVVDSIKANSRALITDIVVAKVSSKIALSEELLNSKAASIYLADYQRETIVEEINSFKLSPYDYVESLTLNESESIESPSPLKSKNPLKNALFKKIFGWKKELKNYFNKAFSGLIIDIRIFIASNVIALVIAAIACYKQAALGRDSLIVSAILTGVIALSTLSYVDQNWFFTILLNNYYGYGYLLGILLTTAWLYFEYHNNRDAKS